MMKKFVILNNKKNIYKNILNKRLRFKNGADISCETSFYNSYKWLKNPWPWMNEGGND